MQTDASVSERALSSVRGATVDTGARKYSTPRNQHRQQEFQHQTQMGSVSHLLAGGVAGAVSKTCTAPLARLTILFQVIIFSFLVWFLFEIGKGWTLVENLLRL